MDTTSGSMYLMSDMDIGSPPVAMTDAIGLAMGGGDQFGAVGSAADESFWSSQMLSHTPDGDTLAQQILQNQPTDDIFFQPQGQQKLQQQLQHLQQQQQAFVQQQQQQQHTMPPLAAPIHHQQQQQQFHSQQQNVASASGRPSGPPAHLFASQFQPVFQHASFEVDQDLNGINPSNLFLGNGSTAVNAPIPAMPTQHSYNQPPPKQAQQAQPVYNSIMDQEGAQQSRKRARGPSGAPQVAVAAVHVTSPIHDHNLNESSFPAFAATQGSVVSRSDGSDSPSVAEVPEEHKKVKHQLTDRQRRAKIKESMDALKALVPLEPNQKADQATIVASSVTLVQNLKDEVAELRKKLLDMELSSAKEMSKLEAKRQAMLTASTTTQAHPVIPQLSNSPFTSMMASLNGAGVSMWRLGLAGQILEVNLVFELVSGFSAAEVIGNTPCGPPLFGSLSIMPSAFLKAFSEVPSVPQIQTDEARAEAAQAAQTPSPPLEFPNTPGTPGTTASVTTAAPGAGSTPTSPVVPEATVNTTSTAQSSTSQASVAPLYANASISNFPVVPQTELENFFPYKCKTLIHAQMRSMGTVVRPQPHGGFLVNHLAALPYNHVLKLLCRHHTLWGEILESIVTLCLVRDSNGQPDFILMISTPDCRRLLTPAKATPSPTDSMHAQDIDAMREGRPSLCV